MGRALNPTQWLGIYGNIGIYVSQKHEGRLARDAFDRLEIEARRSATRSIEFIKTILR